MRSNIVKFLLCVDMDSHQIYSLNLQSHDIHIEQNVPQEYRQRAEKDIHDIKKLLQLPGSQWNWQSDRSNRYRRRQMSEYLLHKIINQEPTYLAQSSMSDAFSNVSTLKLIVDISEYVKLEGDFQDLNPATIELNVDLVTCSDEVIKKILRSAYNIFQIKLKEKEKDNQFILQIAGFREYLSGNYSILSYDRVRMSLRGIQYLQVYLTEVCRIKKVFQNFPPIYNSNIQNPQVPWDEFIDTPPFLFYSPIPLQKYVVNQIPNILNNQWARLRPRLYMKEKSLEFQEIRRQQADSWDISIQKQILYSGECDYQFGITLVAINNIHRLLILDDKDNEEFKRQEGHKRRATYNGICAPRYITKASAKQEELHNTSKKKAKVEEQSKKSIYLKLGKGKDNDPSHFKQLNRQLFNPMILNHGNSGSSNMEYIANKFELDVIPYLISIQVVLLYGQTPLTKCCTQQSQKVPFRQLCRWDSQINFSGLKISQLPMELRMCFNMIIHSSNGEEQIIGSTMTEVFDDNGKFKQGLLKLNIWPFYKIDNRLACMNEYYGKGLNHNDDSEYYCKLIIGLPKFCDDMYWSLRDQIYMQDMGFPISPFNRSQLQYGQNKKEESQNNERRGTNQSQKYYQKDWKQTPTTDELAQLDKLLKFDPLTRGLYTDQDKYILLKCRNHYKNLPQAFPIFLCAINWSDPEQIKEVYLMMKVWTTLRPDDALPLLDANISDESVRFYATKQVGKYKDDELVLFMLELTQALMFEQSHFSPLGEMLIERSIMNPWVVGHELFWQLRSQLHIQASYERYSLILEQLLMLFGSYRYELFGEICVNDEIMYVAENIKLEGNADKRKQEMRASLQSIRHKFGETFQFAIDPRMNTNGFLYDKCSVLNSKKLPLWLAMKTAEVRDENYYPEDVKIIESQNVRDQEQLKILRKEKLERKAKPNEKMMIIYKCGDDIRQDLLTLQLIKIMDKIWLDYGYDYRMKPYKVISTLDQVGMIEVVLNSETTSQIHEDSGKFGALNKSSIVEYLRKFNKTNMENATENFLRSCAGYCVATYILGIGDRHSGNIMITEMGHLFHIDFGHFLGNFKTKFGFNRERAPFVFTEEMAYVMGGVNGANFQRFQEICAVAYNQVRKHGHLLINIFLMMLSAGMPELQELSDIDYLKQKLQLNIGEQQASELFKKEIAESLSDKWRSFDNLIHNLKRG